MQLSADDHPAGDLCQRLRSFIEKWQRATPEDIRDLWNLGAFDRPTSRQIGKAAHDLVMSGEIEVKRIREDGRTITYYVRIKKD